MRASLHFTSRTKNLDWFKATILVLGGSEHKFLGFGNDCLFYMLEVRELIDHLMVENVIHLGMLDQIMLLLVNPSRPPLR